MDTPTTSDREQLAWAAGFIDDEGHFRLHEVRSRPTDQRRYGQATLTVAQTHKEVLDKLQAILGGKVYGPFQPQKEHHNQVYRYSLWGNFKIEEAFDKLRPWLGVIKIKQAQGAIDAARQLAARPKLKPGPKPMVPKCHPHLKYGARGLCEKCYSADYYRRTHAAQST